MNNTALNINFRTLSLVLLAYILFVPPSNRSGYSRSAQTKYRPKALREIRSEIYVKRCKIYFFSIIMAIGSFSMMAANSYPELPNISASCPTLPYLGKPGKKPRGLKRVRMTTSLPNQAPLSPLGKFNQWMQEKIREANGTPKETVTNEILNGMALNNDIIWYGDIVDKNVLQQSVVTSALPHDCRSEILQYLTKLTPPNRHRPSSSELSNLLDFNGWAEDQLSKVNKSTEQLVVDDILNEMALQNNVIWDGDEAHRNNLKQLILNSDLSVERKNEIIDYLAQLTPNRQLHLFYQRRSKNTARNQ